MSTHPRQSIRRSARARRIIAQACVQPLEVRRLLAATVTALHTFTGTDGANPIDGVIASSSGNDLYGTTVNSGNSGESNAGTIFDLHTANSSLTTLATFDYGVDAEGGLIADAAGNLYGTSPYGGADGDGFVFEVAAGSGAVTTLASLDDTTTGFDDTGGVVRDAAGDLFGTATSGGANGYGTLFEVGAGSNVATPIVTFNGTTTGSGPAGRLYVDAAGNLYGTTTGTDTVGGSADDVYGSIFKVAAGSHALTTLATFNSADGSDPVGSLIADARGDLYGTTETGGANSHGVVFELGAGNNAPTVLGSFVPYYPYEGGESEASSLIRDGKGDLFGTTFGDGGNNYGAVFEVVAGSGTVSDLYSFAGGDDNGTNPSGPLVADASGDLYGVAEDGGNLGSGLGTLFEATNAGFTVTSITATPAANQTAVADANQSFNLGSFAATNGTAPYTVEVNWGDGTGTSFTMNAPGTITPDTHVYTSAGTDTVSVTVLDADSNASNTTTFTATVSAAPSITVSPPGTIPATTNVSQSFGLGSFTASNDTGPYTVDVHWDDLSGPDTISGNDGDDTIFTVNAPGPIPAKSHTFTAAGDYYVTETVTDAGGTSGDGNFTVDVSDPVALTLTPAANQTATAQASQSFNLGSFTESNATGPYTVDVSWGDDSEDTTFTMNAAGTITPQNHTYASEGSDTVSVTVTDADNNASNAGTFVVTVANPVVVTPPAAQAATAGTAHSFTLGSFTDAFPEDGPWTVDVGWGDGTADTTFTQAQQGTITPQTHTYAAAGTDTVTIVVTDDQGIASDPATFTANVAPAVSIAVTAPANQTATAQSSQQFSLGSFTESNATGPYTVDVNWGDDSGDTTFTMNAAGTIAPQDHTYTSAGSDTASITVTDANGVSSNTANFVVTVATPVTSITVTPAAAQTAVAQSPESFGLGSFTESNATGPYSVSVDWGDGTAATTFPMNAPGTIAPQTHTYAAAGTDTVTVTVTDAGNHVSNAPTFGVTVAAPVTTITLTAPATQSATKGTAQSISLGSFTESNGTGPYTIHVNWGDDEQSPNQDVETFTMNAPGTITPESHNFDAVDADTVDVQVVDADDNASNAINFTVNVAAPVVTLNVTPAANQSATTATPQSFALGSFTETNATAPYTVDVSWGDGTADTTFTMNAAGTIAPQSHTYAAQGADTVSVTVTDANGDASSPATFTATVATAPANITVTAASNQTASAGVSQSFALGSFAETSATGPYTVDVSWGDGTADTTFGMNAPGTIAPQSHTYAAGGNDTVTVTVTDSANHTSNAPTFTASVSPVTASITATAASNQSATVNQPQSFSLGSFAETNATGPYTVTVSWGDGTANTTFPMSAAGTIAPQTHTYAAVANDTVSVTVADSAGDTSNTATFTAYVSNTSANITVTAASNQTATAGTPQSFSLGSFAQTNATAPYTVDVSWGDGTADTTFTMSAAGTIAPQNHTYAAAGNDTVSVTVSDAASHTSNTATFTAGVATTATGITVTAASGQTATAGVAQSFALGSFAETNATAPYTVAVNWGDGTAVTTFTLSGPGTITPQTHTYAAAGNETVSVTVSDSASHTSNTATFTASVATTATAITVTAASGQTATTGVAQSFALGSFSQTNATAPYTVSVNWGDGTAATTFPLSAPGTITPQTHTYATAGNDTVSVTVSDSAGHTSNAATFTASVASMATGITVTAASNQTASSGVAESFALGSFSVSNATAPYTVDVNWGDGTAATTFTMSGPGTITPQTHTYAAAGNDTVSVTVSDSAGHTSNAATFTASVSGTAASITVSAASAQTAVAGSAHTFALGSFAETNATGPYTVSVNWGDGTAATTFTMAAAGTIASQPHTYAAGGNDTVSVTVSDSAGHASNAAAFTASVAANAASITVSAASGQSATAGAAQSFSLGTFAETNATGPYTVTVSWGDGTAATTFSMSAPGTIAPQSHTYAAAGNDTVSVTVTDSAGDTSNTATFTASVAGTTPTLTVSAAANQAATVGSAQSFSLGSLAETNATAPYTVTVNWGDGTAATTFSMAAAGTIAAHSHTYAATGTDTVSVTVTDSAGHTSNTATFAVSLNTLPSSITATAAADQSATAGSSQSFALGSFSESNATAPYTVTVNWGDGTAATTFSVAAAGAIPADAHTYAAAGGDTVSVVVTDAAGHTSNTATFAATVAAPTPVITLNAAASQTATPGASQSFALGSFSESNATAPYTVTVNWGDGTAATTFTMAAAGTLTPQSHTYAAVGTDTVSISVHDAAGHTSNPATFTATVANPAVAITVTAAGSQSATAGVAQSFALGSFSESNATAPYTVSVNWGDGTAVSTFTLSAAGTIAPLSHTYAAAANDTVSVTVTDSAGHASNTATFTASVAAQPATITVTAPPNAAATSGVAQSFALGSFTATNATAPYTVTVDWGDGTAPTTFTMAAAGTITPQGHTYAAVGDDTVTVTVADSAGHPSNAATFTATVASQGTASLVVTAAAGQTATTGVAQSFALGTLSETNATAPYTVTVNWGDGTAATTFSLAAAGTITPQSHTYVATGTDTVTVTVTDSAGHTSNAATFAASVVNSVNLTVSAAAPQSATAGSSQSFALGTLSETNATAPYTVTVNWGDGTAGTTFTLAGPGTITPQSHDYAAAASDTVTVTVTDSAGHTSNAATFTATVAAPATSITASAAAGQSATAGTPQSFALGSFAEANATAPYTVTVTWGDGTAATTFTQASAGTIAPQTHTYAAAGSDAVTVSVSDAASHTSNTATFTATVAPATTVLTVTAPANAAATAGTAQSFALGSFAESNATAPYTVTVNWGDGTAATTFSAAAAGTIAPQSHTFASMGTDTVSVTVADAAGHTSAAATFTVTVSQPATPSLVVTAAASQSATAGTAQTFNLGSLAEANATAPYTVTVNWGDGTTATTFSLAAPGPITPQSHTYAAGGSDTVTVTVTDAAGHTSNAATFTATVTSTVTNITLGAGAHAAATTGVAQSFALGSFTAANATVPYTVTVNWGDGTAATTFTQASAGTVVPQTHTFTIAGTDTVSVTVTDAAGHSSNTATFTTTVTAPTPSITLTPPANAAATAGVARSFALGSFTEVSATAPYTVTLNWGDGSADTTFTMAGAGTVTPQMHTFAGAGTDTVSISIADAAGHTSNTATFSVTVGAPMTTSVVVTPAPSQAAMAGVAQTFALGSFSQSNATTPYTVSVNWGDGTALTTFTLTGTGTITPQSHAYASAGTDTVLVTVTDADGHASNTAAFTATVSNPVARITVAAPANAAAMVGAAETFALGSFTASGATAPFTVTVNWGDGTAATTFGMAAAGTITPQAHTYATQGTDAISVIVTDAAGHTSNAAAFTADVGTALVVTPPPLQAATATLAESFALGTLAESGATAPFTVSVDWGDGTADTTFTLAAAGTITPQAHTYAAAGTDELTVTVTDSAGHVSNVSTSTVSVGAATSTTLIVTPPASGAATAGVAGSFDLGTLAASNATIPYTVAVNWGDGTAATTFSLADAGTITPQPHTYAAAGTDVVTVTVTDAASHTSNTATFTVSVATAPVTTGVTTVLVHVYDDPDQTGSTLTPAAGRLVFVDSNGDGIYESVEASAITAADGSATLSIPDGQASEIDEVLPTGVVQTLPSTTEVTVQGGTAGQTVNFFTKSLDATADQTGAFYTNYPFANLTAADATFETDAGVTQPDGKVLVAGTETINGVRSAFLARYFTDGEADLNFGTDGIASASAGFTGTTPVGIVVEPDGTIFVAANYASSSGTVAYVASFTAAGVTSGTPYYEAPVGGGYAAVGVTLMPDASVLLAGSTAAGSVFATDLSPTTGAAVSSFGTGGTATYATSVALVPVAPALVNSTGGFYLVDAATDGSGTSLETFSSTGTLDSAVALAANVGSGYTPQAAALDANGDIVIAGVADSAQGSHLPLVITVARITANGAADTTFGTDGVVQSDETGQVTGSGAIAVSDAAVLPDGTVLVTGKYDYAPAGGTPTYQFFAQEYSSAGGVLLGYGQADQLVVSSDTPDGNAALAELSGVLPIVTDTADASPDALIDGSVGFTNTTVPQTVMLTGRSEADLDLETSAPTATYQVPADITAVTSAPEVLQVEYKDAVSVELDTLGADNLLVTLPNGTTEQATYLGIAAGDAQDVYVDYSVPPPGGTWTSADNGTYTVALVANTVANADVPISGNPALGTFAVEVGATTTTPTVTATTVSVTSSVATIDSGNIVIFTATVTGAGGAAVTSGTVTFYDGTTVLGTGTVGAAGTATYSTAALPGGVNDVTATYTGTATVTSATPAALTVAVPAAGAAQLTPSLTLATLPTSVVGGVKKKVTFPVVIKNTGGATERGRISIVLYASTDGRLDANDPVVMTLTRNLTLKAGRSLKMKLTLPDLPTLLDGGTYYLLAQVVDAAGFAQTAGTAGHVAVGTPVVTPTLAITRVTGPATLTPGERTSAAAVLSLANGGNVALDGSVTLTLYLTATGAVDANSAKVVTVTRRVNVAAGKTKSISVPLGSIPSIAAGAYRLAAVVATPAVNGAAAAMATVVDATTVDVT